MSDVTPQTAAADKVFRDQMVALIPSLRSFARGLCGSPDLADDLAQDAMMRAWAARESFMPGTNFRAWMFVILRNQFYSTIRKNSRMTTWDPEAAERILVQPAEQQHAIHLTDLAAAMQKLRPEQREVLMLIGANGLSYEEAADIVGCAIGTIKSRVARGRRALQALIDGESEDAILESTPEPLALMQN
jgi:RNA polymerase sigma-70 factor, ECF subfamily